MSKHSNRLLDEPSQSASPKQSSSEQGSAGGSAAEFSLDDFSFRQVPVKVWLIIGAVTLAFLWSYWPTLLYLLATWNKDQDYSHGPLVLPLALYALWTRRDTLPLADIHYSWWGLTVLGACFVMRYLGGLFYLDAADGWSILLWVAGVCWLLGGWRFLRWTAPGVAFLIFMIPLPHETGRAMRLPLQKIATKLSCFFLQSMGQPALAEGTTIRLGEHHLQVEEACSGIRIFVTIIVMAFAYIMIVRPPWWERLVLILAIFPIALLSNALRIVVTGLLYQFVSGEAGMKFSHDFAGYLMMPIAAGMFALVLWYMSKLIQEVQPDQLREQVYRHSAA